MSATILRLATARVPALPLLAAGVVLLTVLGIGIGSSFMPPGRVVAALLGTGERADELIVRTLRLPRVMLALLAGAALALAGAILQRITRNPLAAPSVLGITDGAAVGVVAFLWIFSDDQNALTVSIHWQPLAAALGAGAFAFLVAALTLADPRGRGPMAMILYGIALAAMAKAAVTLMIILGPVYRANQAMTWLTGSLGAAHWTDVAMVAAVVAAAFPALVLAGRPLRQLSLDGDTARTTGLPLGPMQAALLGLAVVLTAAAVSHVGAVGFVGLIAPHVARATVGAYRHAYLPAVALFGAALVLGADIVARVAMPPLELPAGALTALIGAPLFITLLLRRRLSHG